MERNHTHRIRFAVAALAFGALLTPPATSHAQDAAPQPPELKLTADTTLVLIPVAVADAQNRFVLGLRKGDFHLFEESVEQAIAFVSGEDAPLSVGLIFDESGSMGYKLRNSQAAVKRTPDSRHPLTPAIPHPAILSPRHPAAPQPATPLPLTEPRLEGAALKHPAKHPTHHNDML